MLGGKIHWTRDRRPTPVLFGFPCGSAGKESACNAEDLGSIPGLGRPPEEGKGYPLQYSSLENSMDCIVYGVAKSRTRLSNFHFPGNSQSQLFCTSYLKTILVHILATFEERKERVLLFFTLIVCIIGGMSRSINNIKF